MRTCEIITTGTELLLGLVTNTHPNYIAPQLSALGIRVTRVVTVGDERATMADAIRGALQRADVLIITGGLGPTTDDFTRDVVAELLGCKLVHHEEILERIRNRFRERGLKMLPAIAVQAQVPEGASVLPNDHGTAPGLVLSVKREARSMERTDAVDAPCSALHDPRLLILLPGPLRELKPMFDKQVVPLLRERGLAEPVECRVWRTVGIGESLVAQMVGPIIQGRANVEIGYCARPNEVDVRLITHGPRARALADELEVRIREKLSDIIFGGENDRLEDVVVRELIRQKKTVATAESCTGGLLAHRITNVSGSSAVFVEGVVCYSNEAKVRDVGVNPETIKGHGAVSEPVAREMAEGVRRHAGTDFGMGMTGIAGPTGDTPEKPVGLVFIALASAGGTELKRGNYKFDRETFKFVTTQTALDMLRRTLRVS